MSSAVNSSTLPAYPWQRQGFDPPMEFQSFAPVNPVRLPSGDTGWAVTGHRQARALLADPRLSADRLKAQVPAGRMNDPDATVPPGMFILQDPPEHTHYRRMLTGQFTVRRMQKLEPRVEQIVAEQLDALAAAGSPADLVTHFALPVPSLVICELLGVHYEDRPRTFPAAHQNHARHRHHERSGPECFRGNPSISRWFGSAEADTTRRRDHFRPDPGHRPH
ncbi:cytochrome P450 family protein [Fodinicola feengrottensis]|uniref:hypothetical protein n=1 Tax=Fodinicola feengrottensis TaxID=435914 RepID=UPI0024418582|nr:hypothetical protein [Fodinicola feengrottensis]